MLAMAQQALICMVLASGMPVFIRVKLPTSAAALCLDDSRKINKQNHSNLELPRGAILYGTVQQECKSCWLAQFFPSHDTNALQAP